MISDNKGKGEDLDLNSDNVSVFPLATPIIAGPAAITSVIVSVSDIGTNFTNQTVGMFSLIIVLFLTFIIFFIASKFSKLINKKIIGVISRVVAIILVGLSVQYILDGIKTFLSLIKISNYFWDIIFKIKKTFIAILPRKLI